MVASCKEYTSEAQFVADGALHLACDSDFRFKPGEHPAVHSQQPERGRDRARGHSIPTCRVDAHTVDGAQGAVSSPSSNGGRCWWGAGGVGKTHAGTPCFGWVIKSAEAYDLPTPCPMLRRVQRSLFQVLPAVPSAAEC